MIPKDGSVPIPLNCPSKRNIATTPIMKETINAISNFILFKSFSLHFAFSKYNKSYIFTFLFCVLLKNKTNKYIKQNKAK